jgi:hypothetical protein
MVSVLVHPGHLVFLLGILMFGICFKEKKEKKQLFRIGNIP